jgi:hypothetical protein
MHLVCDDGFRITQTSNKDHFQNPKVHMNATKPVISMINNSNKAEFGRLCDRTVEGPREGFGALLPSHSRAHERRFFSTESRDHFGYPGTGSSLLRNAAKMRMAGTNQRPFENQKVKVIGNLMGENFVATNDPQERVDVQRTWLPQTDVAIQYIDNAKARMTQTNMFDNATSLCIGEGDKIANPTSSEANYARKAQDVTRIPNQVITRK